MAKRNVILSAAQNPIAARGFFDPVHCADLTRNDRPGHLVKTVLIVLVSFVYLATTACDNAGVTEGDTASDTGGETGDDSELDPNIGTPLDDDADVTTTLFLAEPGNGAIVNEDAVTVSGSILSDAEITVFNYALNGGAEIDVTAALDERYFFSFTLTGLTLGANTVVLRVENAAGNTVEESLALTYEIASGDDAGDGDDTGAEDGADTSGNDSGTGADDGGDDDSGDGSDDGEDSGWEWPWDLGIDWGVEEVEPEDRLESGHHYSIGIQGIRSQINDLDSLLEKLLPAAAKAEGIEGVRIEDNFTVKTGETHPVGCNYDWSLTATSTQLWPEIDDAAIRAAFQSGNEVCVKITSDNALMEVAMKFEAYAPSILCPEWEAEFDVVARDLTVSLEFELGLEGDATIQVKDIINADFEFDSREVKNLSLGEKITMWVWSGVDLDKVDRAGKEGFNDIIQDALNEVLDHAWRFSGETEEPVALSYDAAMTDFATSSSDALVSEWDLDLGFETDRHSCANQLTWSEAEDTTGSIPKWGEFGVQVPFSAIARLFYAFGRTGLFCRDYEANLGDAAVRLSLFPKGEIAVLEADEETSTSLLEIRIPMAGTLDDGDSETGTAGVGKNAPGAIDLADILTPHAIESTAGGTPARTGTLRQGDFTFTLAARLGLEVNCNSGLSLRVDELALEDTAGEISLYGISFDVAELEPLFNIVAEGYADAYTYFTLAPKILDIDLLGDWAIELDEVGVSGDALNLGLSVVPEDYCDD